MAFLENPTSMSSGDEYFDYSQWDHDMSSSSPSSSSSSPHSPGSAMSSDDGFASTSPYSGGSSPPHWDGEVSTPPSSTYSDGADSPTSSVSSKKSRSRRVEDREKTAKVRDNKACLRCHMRKVPCEVGPCTQCEKFVPAMGQEACIHEGRLSSIGLVFAYFQQDTPQKPFDHSAHPENINIPVRFDTTPFGQTLNLRALGYPGETGSFLSIDPHGSPRWEELAAWASNSLRNEDMGSFKAMLNEFLMQYVNCGPQMPKHDFAQNVWQLLCMYRIWKTPAFIHYDGMAHPELDSQIHRIALSAMRFLERNVIETLDSSLNWAKTKSFKQAEEKPVLLVCMWQLILLYRELNQVMGSWQGIPNFDRMSHVARRLYLAMMVFYTGHFYQVGSLTPKFDASLFKTSAQAQQALDALFAQVLTERTSYLSSIEPESIQSWPDKYLFQMVLEHEKTKLAKRSRSKKNATPMVPLVVPATDAEIAMQFHANMDLDVNMVMDINAQMEMNAYYYGAPQ